MIKSRLAFIPMLLMAVAATACTSCSSLNPFAAAEGVDEQGYAALGTYEVFQKQIEKVAADTSLPAAVRLAAADADKAAVPILRELNDALTDYEVIKLQLDAGNSTKGELAIAIANLKDWTERAKDAIAGIKKAVSDAAKIRAPMASTAAPFNLAYGSA